QIRARLGCVVVLFLDGYIVGDAADVLHAEMTFQIRYSISEYAGVARFQANRYLTRRPLVRLQEYGARYLSFRLLKVGHLRPRNRHPGYGNDTQEQDEVQGQDRGEAYPWLRLLNIRRYAQHLDLLRTFEAY